LAIVPTDAEMAQKVKWARCLEKPARPACRQTKGAVVVPTRRSAKKLPTATVDRGPAYYEIEI